MPQPHPAALDHLTPSPVKRPAAEAGKQVMPTHREQSPREEQEGGEAERGAFPGVRSKRSAIRGSGTSTLSLSPQTALGSCKKVT